MNLVTRYLQWLKEHELDTYAYPPASDAEITAFETAQGIALPLCYANCIYNWAVRKAKF